MSGVYIKGMQMPESCLRCGFKINCDDCEGYECFCAALHRNIGYLSEVPSNYRLGDCPLIPVPDHGRLIDADAMENGLRLMAKYQEGDRQQGILGCCETIRLAPTIIPADKEGEA